MHVYIYSKLVCISKFVCGCLLYSMYVSTQSSGITCSVHGLKVKSRLTSVSKTQHLLVGMHTHSCDSLQPSLKKRYIRKREDA